MSTDDSTETLLDWWSEMCGLPASVLAPHVYSLHGMEAASHLYRVAAGLDSVVIGEAQIVGQVASSLRHSVSVHAASPLLKLAFKGAVRAGERARGMVWGRLQAASLGSAAVDAAAVAADGLAGRDVLVIGAGEIAELALRSLAQYRPRRVTIANRTVEAAAEMGAHHGADACALNLLPTLLPEADVVIAATRAMHPLVDSRMVGAALAHRPDRPMTIVDVSLPRNVDVHVRGVSGVRLIGIDDLGPYVVATHSERRAVIPVVERIVDDEIATLQGRIMLRLDAAARNHRARHHAQPAAAAASIAV